MKRREFITLIGGAAVTGVILPNVAHAETSAKRPIIAIPAFYAPLKVPLPSRFFSQFPQGLQELGYVLGRDLDMRYRNAGGDRDRWPAVLDEITLYPSPSNGFVRALDSF